MRRQISRLSFCGMLLNPSLFPKLSAQFSKLNQTTIETSGKNNPFDCAITRGNREEMESSSLSEHLYYGLWIIIIFFSFLSPFLHHSIGHQPHLGKMTAYCQYLSLNFCTACSLERIFV